MKLNFCHPATGCQKLIDTVKMNENFAPFKGSMWPHKPRGVVEENANLSRVALEPSAHLSVPRLVIVKTGRRIFLDLMALKTKTPKTQHLKPHLQCKHLYIGLKKTPVCWSEEIRKRQSLAKKMKETKEKHQEQTGGS
ncbi:hypothetical protein J0S82_009978 [Galemys pyrenaicus]|uniref:40S ribosomal protein S6 n=1 Tax=Galemys pyrenaicus TaxID=202257 RepID=A0A8J6AIE3_GALPY|nr:hypothetical protein J0S82_009978 [Galemys pyrenaicus]